MPKMGISIFWFRRDLRLDDNAGLYHALKSGHQVVPIFIFDKHILDELPQDDARVTFIHQELTLMKDQLNAIGSDLHVFYGIPEIVWPSILTTYEVSAVFTNRDYEPYAQQRDQQIHQLLQAHDIPFNTFKDHVIFEYSEVLKADGGAYTVFSPYARRWMERLQSKVSDGISYYLKPYPCEGYSSNYMEFVAPEIPSLESMGFVQSDITIPAKTVQQGVIKNYESTRNFPSILGTSRLGIHFRFGTISIREKALKALALSQTFVNELIWRDFYAQILAHFPHVVGHAFRPAYDSIPWRYDENEFKAWCEGKTGYPIVDAGMRELNTTGYMHNRVRMVTASFLTKHLLHDWRKGEAYFALKLLDFDLASNNGGWQWAAGSGTDAAPYFRIFNPISQAEKFDKDSKYIKKWVPEFGTIHYPKPIVDHKFARERCLDTYKSALG
jgi:deoxyribodipyrimidine photo-lyase